MALVKVRREQKKTGIPFKIHSATPKFPVRGTALTVSDNGNISVRVESGRGEPASPTYEALVVGQVSPSAAEEDVTHSLQPALVFLYLSVLSP